MIILISSFSLLVAAGISNTTTMFDTHIVINRQRYPRYIGKDRVLHPYDQEKAKGAQTLRALEKILDVENPVIFLSLSSSSFFFQF